MSPDLLTETTRLLKRRSKELSQRDIALGAGVSQKWVSLLQRGEIKNPGYKNLSKVYGFLKAAA